MEDQRLVEEDHVTTRDLGRGWRRFPMLNNEERLDPHGSGPAGDVLRAERACRHLTALDEGRAWRRRATGSLLVARLEMFAHDGSAHRRTWQEYGAASLEEVWRQGWVERGVTPGWIEARVHEETVALLGSTTVPLDEVDVVRVEDHTGAERQVAVYVHATLWVGRFVGTLTLRSDLGEEPDPALGGALGALRRGVVATKVSRRSDRGRGSA